MAVSQVRQNFHEDSENGINKQINMELYASYVYMSMVSILNSTRPYVPFKLQKVSNKNTHFWLHSNQYYGLVLGPNIFIA